MSFCKQHKNTVKRLFDLTIAISSVIILSPLLIFIGFLVRMRIGAPVLFRQARPGLHGNPFTIYKFRTMTDERDKDGNLLPDGERLTRLGRFLRKTSMDPQITQIFAD
jgi:lipopolysaccharide/colanic/teichoic acid biosynthesis glycosyltransferase